MLGSMKRPKDPSILKGFNSDVEYGGRSFHVQTEDWGRGNPFFVSQVFHRGAVIKAVKIPYTKVLPKGIDSSEDAIQIALETQHHSILDLLVSGQLLPD
jgi:hypothetical protein